MSTNAEAEGSGTDRSYTGRFGAGLLKGEGVAASMDISSQFRDRNLQKPSGIGLSAVNPTTKQFGLLGHNLPSLNMNQLGEQ